MYVCLTKFIFRVCIHSPFIAFILYNISGFYIGDAMYPNMVDQHIPLTKMPYIYHNMLLLCKHFVLYLQYLLMRAIVQSTVKNLHLYQP